MDDLDLVDPELLLSHEAFTSTDSLDEKLINIQNHLLQVDKNHTMSLRHIRFIHQEHINKYIELKHAIEEVKRRIDYLERHTSTKLWQARLKDLFLKEKQRLFPKYR